MRAIPETCTPYKQTPVFDEVSLPQGLRNAHQTKAGTWGKIVVLKGKLRYRILEPALVEYVLDPEHSGVVEPQVLHEVEPEGMVSFYVEFYR